MMNKKLLLDLYCREKLSMVDVADRVGIGRAKVLYWLKKYNIPRRSWSESAYVKQNPKGDPFYIKTDLTKREKELFIAGLMLFWAEGNKANKSIVQLANLDHKMLCLFLGFLRKICRVDENRISLYVRLYKDFDKNLAQDYWSDLLCMPKHKVYVYSHTDERSKVSKQWSRYGIATLQMSSTKLRKWLDIAIDKYLEEQLNIYQH